MQRAAPFALALLLAGPAAAERETFRVVNRTGVEATALHAVRSPRGAAEDWGRNMLGAPLAPEAGFGLRPAESAGCLFDLRLVLANGREARSREVDICTNRAVALDARNVLAGPAVAAAGKPPPLAAAPGGLAAPRPGFPAPGGAFGNPGARVSSGTGFVVARDRVLTNNHVLEGCGRVTVRTADGRSLTGQPLQADAGRDLAVLAVPGDPGPALPFRREPGIRRGEGVVTYGFPLAGLLSSGPTLTTGEVSALSGLRDNPAQFQISAPVQPGNSGGPLLDRQGNVLGVVVSKLNAAGVAARTGDIPQNVNFAIKGTEAAAFLRAAGVPVAFADSRGPDQGAAAVGEVAHRSTVFIRCER